MTAERRTLSKTLQEVLDNCDSDYKILVVIEPLDKLHSNSVAHYLD